MCGISGILNTDGTPVQRHILEDMNERLIHRGPDGHGVFTDGPLGFAHRRLSIIDLTQAASQPMTAHHGRYAITYNGEVYNYLELRAELEREGVTFSTTSDTEVILHAYIRWGASCLDRFNGMFAFGIWDSETSELFLARDRYGIKPLYTLRTPRAFAFASEGKAFLSLPFYTPEMDHEALAEYFTFQNIFTNRTLLKGVTTFPAGHHQTINLRTGYTPPVEYWDFNYEEPAHPAGDREYAEELDRLFRQSVKRCMVGDVEVGAFLSSGMDSGSIAAIASRNTDSLKTFTCGFEMKNASAQEKGFDERRQAAMLARYLGTDHRETCLTHRHMEDSLRQLVWHLDEPRVGQSYPNFFAAKLAASQVKAVLAGTGGDEILGGYPWRYYRALECCSFDAYVEKYYGFWQRLLPDDTFSDLFSPVGDKVAHVRPKEIFRDIFRGRRKEQYCPVDCINHSLYLESKTFLHGLLMVEDKLGMAFGLETRFPFLDNDLVDFATKLPMHLKLRNIAEVIRMNENEPGRKSDKYFLKTNDGKILLRTAMAKYIPDEVANGVKQGFSGPDASWFQKESAQFVLDTVAAPDAAFREFLDPAVVRRLVDRHISGKTNRRLLIWSLICFEQWCREYLHGEEEHAQPEYGSMYAAIGS